MGEVSSMLQTDYGIARKPITTRNPQANSMVERAHSTVHQMIRTHQLHLRNPDDNYEIEGIIAAVGFAMRASVHTTNEATPSQLVFGRDAILNVNFKADWEYIRLRKQHLINQNNKKENAKRKNYTYTIGQKVVLKQDPNRKHGDKDAYTEPHTITEVNDNGTVKLSRNTRNGGVVSSTWNIRNIHPYQA